MGTNHLSLPDVTGLVGAMVVDGSVQTLSTKKIFMTLKFCNDCNCMFA